MSVNLLNRLRARFISALHISAQLGAAPSWFITITMDPDDKEFYGLELCGKNCGVFRFVVGFLSFSSTSIFLEALGLLIFFPETKSVCGRLSLRGAANIFAP